MGAADKDPGPGGGITKGIRDVIQGGSLGGVDFQVRDVVPEPLHGIGPGQFSAKGRTSDHREAAKESQALC